jgi:hypothetical protein
MRGYISIMHKLPFQHVGRAILFSTRRNKNNE